MAKAFANKEYVDFVDNKDEISIMAKRYNNMLDKINHHINDLSNQKTIFEQKAKTDRLTGLYNRHHYDEVIDRLIKANGDFYLVAFDIDFFKKVNDTYGHNAGDYVLESFAKMVKSMLRGFDLVFRMGGEEFVVILEDVDDSSAYKIVDRIRVQIENNQLKFENHTIKFTVSAGISKRHSDDDKSSVLDRADKLLYKSKDTGRNKITMEGR
jgi:diguanylate cyclase